MPSPAGPGPYPAPGAQPGGPGPAPDAPLPYAPQGAGPVPPGPYGPGPQYPAGPPGAGFAPPAKKKRVWLWVAIVLGVLLLVGAGVAAYLLFGKDDGKAAIDKTAQQFYQAIADGDAAAALDQLATKPSSTALLTDDVLAASKAAAPISDITTTVESSTADEAQVTVKYRMGGKDVEQTLALQKTDGVWKVAEGTATVDLSAGTGSLPLELNGTRLDATAQAVLFPGTYTLTTPTPYVTLSDNTFEVTDLGSVKVSTVTATLTDDGVAAFQTVVRESVDACVAATTIEMDCAWLPMGSTLSDGTELIDGTVQRTLSPEAQTWLDGLDPALDPDDPALASVPLPDIGTVGVTVFVHGMLNGREISGTIDAVFPFGSPTVNMSDPDNLTVTWD